MTDNDKPDNTGDSTPDVPEHVPESVDRPAGNAPGHVSEPPPDDQPTVEDEPRRGSITYQDDTTTVKEPSLAEQRARREAAKRQREEEEAAVEEAERKKKLRKRILIGTGVTVGVVALIAVIYAASESSEVTARCTDTNGVIVDDAYCDSSYATSHGGYSSGGLIYIGGSSYRYNYGGGGTVGQHVSGGSYVAPSDSTTVKTNSGKTVSRGGLGVSSSGGDSGGKSSSGGKSGGS